MPLTKEEIAELKIGDFVHDNEGNNYVVLAIENGKVKAKLWKPALYIIAKE